MKTLTFEISIDAPIAQVWDGMLGAETYKLWTAPFCEGSYYVGSWEQGASIRFLSPSGDGMIAVIAENRLHEYVSIRHIGMIVDGKDDTTSEKVRAWTPAHENYRFTATPTGCHVTVTLDTIAEYEQYMTETYPQALARLKQLCEP